jgi:hypothetical protein
LAQGGCKAGLFDVSRRVTLGDHFIGQTGIGWDMPRHKGLRAADGRFVRQCFQTRQKLVKYCVRVMDPPDIRIGDALAQRRIQGLQ